MSLKESLLNGDMLDPAGNAPYTAMLESGDLPRRNAPMQATSPDRSKSIEIGKQRDWADGGNPNFGTVASRVLDMAERFPDRPAIRGPISHVTGTYEEISYYDLVQNAGKLASSIREACHSWGHPMTDNFVAILLPRDIEYVVAMLATFLCGAAYLPMSEKLPEERLKYMLEDGKPSLIITSKNNELKETLKGMLNPRPAAQVLYIEDVQLTLRTVVPPQNRVIGHALPADVYSTLPNKTSLAYMIYTSGTTGKPKGVEVEHHSFLNVLLSHVESGTVDKDVDLRKSACVAAFIFDSHVRETWMPLAWGGCLCIADDVLHLTEGTMCAGTPSGLLASGGAESLPAELKTVMAGGERLTEQVVRAITYPNTEITKIINAYGPTETVIESLIWKADLRNIPESGVPVGLPISNGIAYGIKISDGERDEAVVKELKNARNPQHLLAPRGVPCELYMGGESCARGYHNRPDLTQDRFLRDPFVAGVGYMYQTGDLVIFGKNPGDPVTYIGRADTQVKINGKRLELGEVESKLGLLDGVEDIRVLLKKQSGGKQHLVAYVVWTQGVREADDDATLSAGLITHARDTMEDYKRPSFVVNFPITIGDTEHVSFGTIKTAGGKTDLRALPDPVEWSGKAPAAAKDPKEGKPNSGAQRIESSAAGAIGGNNGDGSAENTEIDAEVILHVIQDLLDNQNLESDHLTIDSDFFSSGLSSIDVPRLKFELKTELGVDVSTEAILGNSTAQKLAEFLGKPEDDSGVDINKKDLLDAKDVVGAPLEPWLVWLLSFMVAFVAHAVTLAFWGFAFFVPLLSAHEFGKCWDTTWQTYGFYNQCNDPDKWRAFWVVAAAFPVLWPVSIYVTMLMSVVSKWIVIGKTKPGVYSLDSWYYFRWLFAHYLEVFVRSWLMTQLPFRASGSLKIYLRLMGAQIGKNVVLDTLDVHEMDCLVIDDDVCVQSEAMLSGHTFATVGGTTKNKNEPAVDGRAVLVIGNIWLKKNSVVGPGAVITPQLPSPGTPCSPAKDATIIEGVFPALQASSRLGQSLRLAEPMMKIVEGGRPARETTVWTPPVPVSMQIFGTIVMIFFEWAAVMPPLAFSYAFLVPREPGLLIWWARLALWSSPWVMGIPYAMCMIFFKWTAIGTFRAEQSTPYLDCMRWLLMNLLGNRNQMSFELAGASTEILHGYYRMMGMKIGWNAQVMPVRVVEFDLFSVGDCVAFGGLVSVFCRDANGMQAACSIGEYSAITNSAAMLAGSKIGNNCLVGNLTLLPPHYKVPADSKCVGTKYKHGALQDPVVFKNKSVVKSNVWQANWTMTGHIIASLMFDIPEQPGLVLVSWILVLLQEVDDGEKDFLHLAHLPWGIGFVFFTFNWILLLVVLGAATSIIFVKLSTPKFLSTHVRDSPIMVVFIYLTKLMVNQQGWTQVVNGTPLQSLIYRWMGANISLSARVFMRQFTDVDGLQIGDGAVLAYDCYLEQHMKTATVLEFKPLTIDKHSVLGQRSIVLNNATMGEGCHVYPLSAVAPSELINPFEISGGLLSISYMKRKATRTMRFAATNIKTNVCTGEGVDDVVDMVVVGAGAGGMLAAYEFRRLGLKVRILEKSQRVMGCWQTAANDTSHVAVSEATYRFPGKPQKNSGNNPTSDYPTKKEVLERGQRFFRKYRLSPITEFGAEVTNIQDFAPEDLGTLNLAGIGASIGIRRREKNCVDITYNIRQGATGAVSEKKIRARGVYIATGAQTKQRQHTFPGEQNFEGQVAYGSANDLHEIIPNVKGKKVAIIGGGAFAIENARTMLLNGAAHVTIIHRSKMQVWPRSMHYLLSTEKDRKFGEYAHLYEKAVNWAGYEVGGNNLGVFMDPTARAQPTASDVFFAFAKMGLISLVRGEVIDCSAGSLFARKADQPEQTEQIDCGVMLKCVGWVDPEAGVKAIFPAFKTRSFVFLNSSPRVVFSCDPHYSHGDGVATTHAALMETTPIGGTFSVLILARLVAWLQIYSLGNPSFRFESMLENMEEDKRAVCSWNEQKFSFPQCEEVTDILLYKINQFKGLVQQKHATLEEFLTMSNGLLMKDLKRHEQSIIGGSCTTNPEGLVGGFWDMVMNSALAKDVYEAHKDDPILSQSNIPRDSSFSASVFGRFGSVFGREPSGMPSGNHFGRKESGLELSEKSFVRKF